jgi:hypothetical protein
MVLLRGVHRVVLIVAGALVDLTSFLGEGCSASVIDAVCRTFSGCLR